MYRYNIQQMLLTVNILTSQSKESMDGWIEWPQGHCGRLLSFSSPYNCHCPMNSLGWVQAQSVVSQGIYKFVSSRGSTQTIKKLHFASLAEFSWMVSLQIRAQCCNVSTLSYTFCFKTVNGAQPCNNTAFFSADFFYSVSQMNFGKTNQACGLLPVPTLWLPRLWPTVLPLKTLSETCTPDHCVHLTPLKQRCFE